MRAAILTVSSSIARKENADTSGAALADLAREAGAEVVVRDTLPDDLTAITKWLRAQRDAGIELALTTGGTGFTSDDLTPEATRKVIERDVPGIAEAMRAESLKHTPMGMLSRGVSGIARKTLIVNFPGSPKAIRQLFPVIAPVLGHAVSTLNREPGQPTPGH